MKLCSQCKEAMRLEKQIERGAIQCEAQSQFGHQCRRRTTYPNKRCYHHGGSK